MINWLKARLNKDNFCNIMFWLGMTVGLGASFLFGDEYPIASCILWWSTIIGVPLAIAKSSKITFSKEHGFFDSKGRTLLVDGRYPNAIGAIFAACPITALAGLVIDSHGKNLNLTIALTLIIAIFFFVPTLYCIIKNCPIAIIFNKNAWRIDRSKEAITNVYTPHSYNFREDIPSSLTPRDYYSNPLYSGVGGNIYHNRR